MFRSARFRLTAVYFALLVLVAAFLSFNWYRVAVSELDNVGQQIRRGEAVLRERGAYSNRPMQTLEEIVQEREKLIEQSKQEVAREIVVVNIILLSAGGVIAYLLAKRTLRPIENSHQALERFTSDASHELRTPLTAMRTEIETTLRSKNINQKVLQELAKSNLEEVKLMTLLIENMLLLTRDSQLPTTRVSTKNVVSSAIKTLSTQSSQKNIAIQSKISQAQLIANYDSVMQVLTILLDNAIKYSPVDSTITLKGAKQKNKQYVFEVSDQGPGIPKAESDKIFERFYRGDSSRSSKGFGLGLSIARKLTDMNNGTLELVDTNSQGACFRLTLPLNQQS